MQSNSTSIIQLNAKKQEIEQTFDKYAEEYTKLQSRIKEVESAMQQLRGMYSAILDAIKIVNSEADSTKDESIEGVKEVK